MSSRESSRGQGLFWDGAVPAAHTVSLEVSCERARGAAEIGFHSESLIEETLTPAEHGLVRLGKHQELRDLRMLFQYADIDVFGEPVERLTGRKVRAFVSGMDTKADLATEMFVLHPPGYKGPGRCDIAAD